MCEYHLWTIHNYNYIYETKSMPSLLFPVIYKVLSRHNIFIKSDYILKNLGTRIDCNFNNQSIIIKVIMFW